MTAPNYGWVFSNTGGGWEYPLFLLVISTAVALQARPVTRENAIPHGEAPHAV